MIIIFKGNAFDVFQISVDDSSVCSFFVRAVISDLFWKKAVMFA